MCDNEFIVNEQLTFLEEEGKKLDWKEIVRKRGNYRCVNAKGDLDRQHNTPLNVHHLMQRRYGGKDDPSNAILLCRNCHAGMHPEFEQLYFSKNMKLFGRFVSDFFSRLLGKPSVLRFNMALKLLTGTTMFRPHQEEIIRDIVEHGKSMLIVMPTGSGKSVLYQIPGLINGKQSLVVSPLISLMTDQVKHLQSRWIPCTYVNSTLKKKEKEERLANIQSELYKFVFAHPKQFLIDNNGEVFVKSHNQILNTKYSYFIVDEAHLMDIWGRAFIKEYAKLKKVREYLSNPTLILLTATANRRMQKKLVNLFDDNNIKIHVSGFYRPELKLKVQRVSSEVEKVEYISNIISKVHSGKVLIFVPTIKIGNQLTEALKDHGYDPVFYHGKLDADTRHLLHMRYSGDYKPELNVLIATSAFGMGVNIPNIREVVHYSMPSNIIDYYQQAGRAGRDGSQSIATLLYKPNDKLINEFLNNKTLEKMSDKNSNTLEVKETMDEELKEMLNYIKAKNK